MPSTGCWPRCYAQRPIRISGAQELTMAVREMGSNAIEWGHKKQVNRLVAVTYRMDAEKVTVVIQDTGPGFDRRNLPHAAQAEDPCRHMEVRGELGIRDGGFGILMTNGLVDEEESFRAYAEVMPKNCIFLVDTYDTIKGVKKAVKVAKLLKENGVVMTGVRLDSGDLASLSIQVRKMLDDAGMSDAKIMASNELDEFIH